MFRTQVDLAYDNRQSKNLFRWENLRKNAMKRQTEIHENLMFMQKNEMKKLRDWMTDMEDRISQMGEILFSTIKDHVKDQSMLELDITEHQVCSYFFIFWRSWDF